MGEMRDLSNSQSGQIIDGRLAEASKEFKSERGKEEIRRHIHNKALFTNLTQLMDQNV